MMKKLQRLLIALFLAASLLLTGCSGTDLWLTLQGYTPFSQIEYTRPDVSLVEQSAQKLHAQLDQQTHADKLMEYVYDFYSTYHDFYTNYYLANIYYCKDVTDLYWEKEYTYCLENGTQVDLLLDQVLRALAACPLVDDLESEDYFGEGFFDAFQGESLWTDAFTALMDREAQLQSKYYDLSAQALESANAQSDYDIYNTQMAALFAELVILRQQIAEEAGFADYPSFAYDFYYDRDYTPSQSKVLLDEIAGELVPLYRQNAAGDVWQLGAKECFEKQTFSYVKDCASAMGGRIQEAFHLMKDAQLYDISYGANKYNASFEVFLTSYFEPYLFLNPTLRVYDQLTFAHEFGHFCNDYASGGSVAGIDVAEVFSQGMEYLSLSYGNADPELQQLKMADCLSVYVEQAAYASFEQQVYLLDAENLTADQICALYEQVCKTYGLDSWQSDSCGFVQIPHFFTNPLYIISYVVSNDAALQIYQLEQASTGAGLALYEKLLDSLQSGFLSFLEEAGLQSPFAQGRLADVRKLLETQLK